MKIRKDLQDSYKRAKKQVDIYPYIQILTACYFLLSVLFIGFFDFLAGYIFGIGLFMWLLGLRKYVRAKRWLKANS